DYTGQVEVILRLPRTLTGENPPESTRRARNTIGGIRADIEAAFGSTGAFATGMCASEGPFLPSNTGADADAIIGILRIEFFA
ncbi:MAG TPA: hypothetical protein VD838_16030, partial [Anaeromyxobacteraceae bacterium]|nr:hypothetical protein [Anaeromyxobacteraceae bacterium]